MGLREKLERIMMAITFAEAGEHDTAREIMREEQRQTKRKRVEQRPTSRKQLRAPSIRPYGITRFYGKRPEED